MVARSNTVLLAGVIGAPEESPCGVIGFEWIPSARFTPTASGKHEFQLLACIAFNEHARRRHRLHRDRRMIASPNPCMAKHNDRYIALGQDPVDPEPFSHREWKLLEGTWDHEHAGDETEDPGRRRGLSHPPLDFIAVQLSKVPATLRTELGKRGDERVPTAKASLNAPARNSSPRERRQHRKQQKERREGQIGWEANGHGSAYLEVADKPLSSTDRGPLRHRSETNGRA